MFSSSSIAKQIEKEVSAEAKREEKELRHVVKDLRHGEKRDQKVHKTTAKQTDKTEKTLERNENKEQKALETMHRATEKYEQTKMKTSHLQHELESLRREEQKIHQDVYVRKAEVEDAMVEKEKHEQTRLTRLQEAKKYKGETGTVPAEGAPSGDVMGQFADPRQLH